MLNRRQPLDSNVLCGVFSQKCIVNYEHYTAVIILLFRISGHPAPADYACAHHSAVCDWLEVSLWAWSLHEAVRQQDTSLPLISFAAYGSTGEMYIGFSCLKASVFREVFKKIQANIALWSVFDLIHSS